MRNIKAWAGRALALGHFTMRVVLIHPPEKRRFFPAGDIRGPQPYKPSRRLLVNAVIKLGLETVLPVFLFHG